MLLILAAAPLLAQPANPLLLVSADWLAAHLNDRGPVMLHVGTRKGYEEGHIPGARLVTLADLSVTGEAGLRLELPQVPVLEAALRKLGVGEAGRVVVYPGAESNVQSATRVWFTLDYLGLGNRAALLDGGLTAWKAAGGKVTQEATPEASGNVTAKAAPERVVDAGWLRTRLNDPKVQVLDARLAEFHSGANAGGMPRGGRIPGARNVPYNALLEKDGKLKATNALRRALQPRDGAVTAVYCHIGQQATVLYFVGRYLGLDVRLYDGSFQDWSRRTELPVEPAAK
ncbi:MAG: sulfurtransferase [Acidobacteria bacterium]|nr:sulfurtransferase [Acidobacteriota bacterium]